MTAVVSYCPTACFGRGYASCQDRKICIELLVSSVSTSCHDPAYSSGFYKTHNLGRHNEALPANNPCYNAYKAPTLTTRCPIFIDPPNKLVSMASRISNLPGLQQCRHGSKSQNVLYIRPLQPKFQVVMIGWGPLRPGSSPAHLSGRTPCPTSTRGDPL